MKPQLRLRIELITRRKTNEGRPCTMDGQFTRTSRHDIGATPSCRGSCADTPLKTPKLMKCTQWTQKTTTNKKVRTCNY